MSLSALLMQDFFVMLLEGMHDVVLHAEDEHIINGILWLMDGPWALARG